MEKVDLKEGEVFFENKEKARKNLATLMIFSKEVKV